MAETLDPRLLEVIVCPQCRGELALVHDALECAVCALRYPIRSGIPVLLATHATPIN